MKSKEIKIKKINIPFLDGWASSVSDSESDPQSEMSSPSLV